MSLKTEMQERIRGLEQEVHQLRQRNKIVEQALTEAGLMFAVHDVCKTGYTILYLVKPSLRHENAEALRMMIEPVAKKIEKAREKSAKELDKKVREIAGKKE